MNRADILASDGVGSFTFFLSGRFDLAKVESHDLTFSRNGMGVSSPVQISPDKCSFRFHSRRERYRCRASVKTEAILSQRAF